MAHPFDASIGVYAGKPPEPRTKPQRLGPSSREVLALLEDHGDIESDCGEAGVRLAELLGWRSYRIHNTLPQLEERGFVRREGTRRRFSLIGITDAGRRALDALA